MLLPVGGGRWAFAHHWYPERGETAFDYTAERWVELLRTATGMPGLVPEILGVRPFTMAAERGRAATGRGPGFLAGDAAHRMTPVGGVGMNTAMHDGHELGWRLAWVVRGLAGEALLDSYAASGSRSGGPTRCARCAGGRARPGRRAAQRPGRHVPVGRGRRRRPAAGADRTRGPPGRGSGRRTCGSATDGRRRRALDLFEDRLTLLAGRDGETWVGAGRGWPGCRWRCWWPVGGCPTRAGR